MGSTRKCSGADGMQQRSFWNVYIDQVVEAVIRYNAGVTAGFRQVKIEQVVSL